MPFCDTLCRKKQIDLPSPSPFKQPVAFPLAHAAPIRLFGKRRCTSSANCSRYSTRSEKTMPYLSFNVLAICRAINVMRHGSETSSFINRVKSDALLRWGVLTISREGKTVGVLSRVTVYRMGPPLAMMTAVKPSGLKGAAVQ